MKFFDPHIHMTSRTTDDYMAMYKAGIRAVIEPAFWLGQPRTHAGSFDDYFQSITGWERFRASQFGIRHFCTICLNAKEANNPEYADEILELLPRYLEKDNVVGVGEIGYDDMTDHEHKLFKVQLEMAKERDLPVIVHTPHRDKINGVKATIDLIREVGIDETLVVIDHNNEETLPYVLETNCWAGHTIYPHSKMDADRMVDLIQQYGSDRILVNSSADWGISNPLAVPVTAGLMKDQGFEDEIIQKVMWDNPIALFEKSGVFTKAELETELEFDQSLLFQGNSVLRGQRPEKRTND
ncbi:hydrolase, TatD family protein [Lentisphaera araneosa HTCC2155]|uniref:Hydrolase, TatD family protein n=1 Tax=Lentisphaera araneosa HTCC2155 TaxID=313628 RepID=A6DT94_9BACT|nr:TatD family hydrolase [Lentisphaera araneosa]EDM25167.1 hydrolase, TatD family protein [Lentisphaera araneosa HTCC2155]